MSDPSLLALRHALLERHSNERQAQQQRRDLQRISFAFGALTLIALIACLHRSA